MAGRIPAFRSPITKAEKTFGILYIIIHSAVMPQLVALFYMLALRPGGTELSELELNLICYSISFALVLIFMFRFLRQSFSDIFDDFGRFVTSVALAYVAYYAVSFVINTLLSYVLPDLVNPSTEAAISLTKQNANVVTVVAVLFAPVVEEAMFRGALFGALRPKSRLLAYIVTAALFAVYHLWAYFLFDFHWSDLLYLLQYLPVGLALTWCYERSRTIWASIIMHAMVNVLAVTVQINL